MYLFKNFKPRLLKTLSFKIHQNSEVLFRLQNSEIYTKQAFHTNVGVPYGRWTDQKSPWGACAEKTHSHLASRVRGYKFAVLRPDFSVQCLWQYKYKMQ